MPSFNPHPAFLPGDASPLIFITLVFMGFNPHPAFLPGDAVCLYSLPLRSMVSIRTRHFCRVMLADMPAGDPPAEFQSAPGISAG